MPDVAEQLRSVDIGELTGSADLLRTVSAFQKQFRDVTPMLNAQVPRVQLLKGVMGLDAARRDALGTAIGASAISGAIRMQLPQKKFVDYTAVSLGTLASAQLSTPSIQAFVKPSVAFSAGALVDRRKLAAYRGLGEQFNRAIVGTHFARPGSFALESFGRKLRTILDNAAGGAWKLVRLRQDIDDNAIVFVERHGWPLPLALPLRVVHRVVGMASRGKREVQRFMCDNFGPRTPAYSASRERLLSSEHYQGRRPPIEQGLKALNRGHYYASICTLLPLVEGVLIDVVLADDPPERRVAQTAFEEMQEVAADVDAVVLRSVETLIISATSGAALFSHFDRRDYGQLGETRRLNRHAILHGSARRYGTHANALRLFLLLVALAEALDIYTEERDR